MSLISKILRNAEDGGLVWWCPGCDMPHQIHTGQGTAPRWDWNGNADKPTFTPSVLVRGHGLTAKGKAQHEAWAAAGFPKPWPDFDNAVTVCHSFVIDGRMQMLGDCTHDLAGQTVPIPPWPSDDTWDDDEQEANRG